MKKQFKSGQTLNKEFVKKAIFQRYFWEIKISFVCFAIVFFYATFSFSEVRVERISSIFAVCIILYFIVIVNLPNDLYASMKRNQVKYLELLRQYNLFEITRSERMIERANTKLEKGEPSLVEIPLLENQFLPLLQKRYKSDFDPICWNIEAKYNNLMTYCGLARSRIVSFEISIKDIDSLPDDKPAFSGRCPKAEEGRYNDLLAALQSARFERECIVDYISQRKKVETQIGELLKAMDAYKIEGDYEKSGLLSFVTRFF